MIDIQGVFLHILQRFPMGVERIAFDICGFKSPRCSPCALHEGSIDNAVRFHYFRERLVEVHSRVCLHGGNGVVRQLHIVCGPRIEVSCQIGGISCRLVVVSGDDSHMLQLTVVDTIAFPDVFVVQHVSCQHSMPVSRTIPSFLLYVLDDDVFVCVVVAHDFITHSALTERLEGEVLL